MNIYEIPVCVRYISIGDNRSIKRKVGFDVVDNEGVFVSYSTKEPPSRNLLKNIEPDIRETFFFIVAESYAEAMIQVFRECKGMVIGGSDILSKASWFDTDRAIIEFPPCFMMNKNKEGIFVCGEPMSCGGGYFGDCFVTNHKFNADCPIVHCRIVVFYEYQMHLRFAHKVKYRNVEYKLIKIERDLEPPKVNLGYIPIKTLIN